MSRAITKFLGITLMMCLLAGGLLMQSAPAGARTRRSAGAGNTGVFTQGEGFDYRKLKPKLSKV